MKVIPVLDQHTDTTVVTWTAARLLAGPEPAYGSASFRDDPVEAHPEPGTVYALPRHRVVLDWRRACADGDQ